MVEPGYSWCFILLCVGGDKAYHTVQEIHCVHFICMKASNFAWSFSLETTHPLRICLTLHFFVSHESPIKTEVINRLVKMEYMLENLYRYFTVAYYIA